MAVVVDCPGCTRPLRIPEAVRGQLVRCPLCTDTFVTQAEPPERVPAATAASAPLPGERIVLAPAHPVPTGMPANQDRWPPAWALPWCLRLFPLLALGIPALAVSVAGHVGGFAGSAAWVGLGTALAVGCSLLERQGWSARARLGMVAGVLTLGCGALVAAFLVAPQLPAEVDPSAWKLFRPAGGRCQVLMPGTPQVQRQVRNGFTVDVHAVTLERPRWVFTLCHLDVPGEKGELRPEEQKEAFEGGKRGILEQTPGTELLQEQEVSAGPYPGREWVFRLSAGPFAGTRVVRMYIIGRRLYTLVAGGPGAEPGAPEVRKFLDSFRFTEEGAFGVR